MSVGQERSVSKAALLVAAAVAMTFCLAAWGCRRDTGGSLRVTRKGPDYSLALEETPVARFAVPELAGSGRPRVDVGEADEAGWRRVRLTWDVPNTVAQDELAVRFDLEFEPDFWWAPHLAPEEGYVVAQHVFRSPAVIAARGPLGLVVVPDLDIVGASPENPWFGPADYGFTMENYGHGGRTSPEGEGMGVFTICDWGNGAAAEAAMRILDHYGPLSINKSGTQYQFPN